VTTSEAVNSLSAAATFKARRTSEGRKTTERTIPLVFPPRGPVSGFFGAAVFSLFSATNRDSISNHPDLEFCQMPYLL